jgi:hypothetical protein
MSSFLPTRACESTRSESERLCARVRHPREENYKILSIVLFHPSVFARTVDVVPDVNFGDLGVAGKLALPSFLRS